MATSAIDTSTLVGTQVWLYEWLAVANGDDGDPVKIDNFTDLCVQIELAAGAGTCAFQGSVDGTTWFSLTDPQGNAISKTASALEAVTELPRFVRPSVSGGDGSTSFHVRLLARRGAR